MSTAIAHLEMFGTLQNHFAHCGRSLAFKQNLITVKGTRFYVRGKVELQRMKIERMINWMAGLTRQRSLMTAIHGHRRRRIITLQCLRDGALTHEDRMEFQRDYPTSI